MKYIKGFDGLRCYSILLVILTHLGIAHSFPRGSYLREHLFYFFSGAAGVNIFFAISGFLITSLILNEKKKTGQFNLKSFFMRRFLRLLPPIVPFYIALFMFMQLGYVRETIIGLWASIFYLFNFVPKAKMVFSTELSHTWSLAVEEQFYILWALVYKHLTAKRIMQITLVLLAVCVLALYLLPTLRLSVAGEGHPLGELFFINRWTIPAIGPILLGALFAKLNFSNYRNIRARFSGSSAGLISLLVFISPLYLPELLMPMVKLFHGLGAVMILLWVFNNQQTRVVNMLEWSPLKYIGTISYGLYIWQGFFVRTNPFANPKIWVHEFPYNIVFTFAVAILSYELFEKRILRLKKRYKVFASPQSNTATFSMPPLQPVPVPDHKWPVNPASLRLRAKK